MKEDESGKEWALKALHPNLKTGSCRIQDVLDAKMGQRNRCRNDLFLLGTNCPKKNPKCEFKFLVLFIFSVDSLTSMGV